MAARHLPLTAGHRVIAPDLPAHGATDVPEGELDASRVLAWLDELIGHTCPAPPALSAMCSAERSPPASPSPAARR